MFVRCAFFHGQIRPGQEDAFHTFIEKRLMPLWAAFPGARAVRVLRPVESDSETTPFLIVQMHFATRQAIENALASDIRARSREVLTGLLDLFEGHIVHAIFASDELRAGG